MSIMARIMAATGSTGVENPRQWLVDWTRGGAKSSAGVHVTPASAMGLSAYYACIRNISEDIGKTPIKVYENLVPRGKRELPRESLYRLLHDAPNPEMSAMTFFELLQSWELGWGSGYAEIAREAYGNALALYPIHPSRVEVVRDKQGQKLFNVRNDDGTVTAIPDRNMFDLRGLGDDLRGYSIARLGSESIGRAMATQQYSARFFGEGTCAAGVFKMPGKLEDDAFDNLKSTWPKGLPNAHNPLFLEEGMEWQPMGCHPEEAQMLGTMDFTVLDLARWFRMQPHKIQHMAGAIRANIEQSAIEYVTDTLMSHYVRWEQEIARKLIRPGSGMFAEFLIAGLLRGDAKARSEYYAKRFSVASLSPNDIRELENENPLGPEGDKYYYPANMVVLGGSPAARDGDPLTGQQNVTDAMHGVFLRTAERLVRKETMAVVRALKRHRAYLHFAEWADRFYAEHRDCMVDAFAPSAMAVWGLLGSPPDDEMRGLARIALTGYAAHYCERNCARVKAAHETNDLKDLCQEWEGDEPGNMANTLMDRLVVIARKRDGLENLN